MMPKTPFRLIYAPQVREHLRALDTRYFGLIRQTIEQQLLFEPDSETRNRKPLVRSVALEGTWEIRFGPFNRFRVFYEVDRANWQVNILASGEKRG